VDGKIHCIPFFHFLFHGVLHGVFHGAFSGNFDVDADTNLDDGSHSIPWLNIHLNSQLNSISFLLQSKSPAYF
jgi:hypothetical protein